MITKCQPVVSGANETKQVSGLRRMLCLTALLVVFVTGARAYDLWVGGVQVTNSNASNITGDNIKCYDANVNGGKPRVYFEIDGSTKRLFLYNVKIERSGKDHHAIENKGVAGLMIILCGNNYLKATDSSPVRLDAITSITTTWSGYGTGSTTIVGGSEDAIYSSKDGNGDSPVITIYDAQLTIQSQSSCFDTSCSPMLTIKRSSISATCTKNKSGDCYALFDFKSLTISNSTVTLQGYSQAIKNLTSLTLEDGMGIDSPLYGWFNSSAKTVQDDTGYAKTVVFKQGTAINATNFPDTNFRNWVLAQSYGKDGALTESEINEIKAIIVENQSISNLKGVEYFTELKSLTCSNNQLTTIDLSKNKALRTVTCYGNKIRGSGADNFISNLPQLNPNEGILLFYMNEVAGGNFMTTEQVSNAIQKGWKVKESNDGVFWGYDFSGGYAINTTNFPDETFRAYVSSNIDTDNDGYLSQKEIGSVTSIELRSKNIASVKGVELFTQLQKLDLFNNKLKELDVSKNTALTQLWCDFNDLTSLNVSKNTALTGLLCTQNQLNTLDVSKNTALTHLYCEFNKLTSLDVSHNTELKCLECCGNNLTTLDVSNNTKLELLSCYGNKIRGAGMTTLVNSLYDRRSASLRGELRVCKNEASDGNAMTAVQVQAATEKGWDVLQYDGSDWVDYEGIPIIEISEENFPDETFRAHVSYSFDTDKDGYLSDEEIAKVTEINVSGKGIRSLKGINHFTELRTLSCDNNQLTTLDMSKNTELQCLSVSGNKLASLDVSKNTKLFIVYCDDNQLTTLDVSSCKNLQHLYCYGNKIRGMGMTALVNSLYDRRDDVFRGQLYVYYDEASDGNAMTLRQVQAATDKGWDVLQYDGSNWVDYEGTLGVIEVEISEANFPDATFRNYISSNIDRDKDGWLYEDEFAEVTEINVSGKGIKSLKGIEYFTELTVLNCSQNNLATLDVSNNTNLEQLDCSQCNLAELDVSHNKELGRLYCQDNQLTELDVFNNKNLWRLECYKNNIRGTAMTALVLSLHYSGPTLFGVLSAIYAGDDPDAEGNMMNPVQVGIAKERLWEVEMSNGWLYKGESVPGDVNGDIEIDEADVQAVLSHIQGETPTFFDEAAADVNEDGVVDYKDALLIGEMAGVPVGIVSMENGKWKMEKGERRNDRRGGVYDLQGRKIETSNFKLQTSKLLKGVNIVGGKKVVIK